MLGLITGAAILIVAQTPSAPTQAERLAITLNGFEVEVNSHGGDWDRDAQRWSPCPPLTDDPGGAHPKARYGIAVNGHRAEVIGWVDPDGFKWLYDDQAWSPNAVPPRTINATAAVANGVVASKLSREGKVTASDPQTQVAVESLIESAAPERLKPPSLKKPSLLGLIPWGWIAAALLLLASLGFVGLAVILALWLLLRGHRS